MVKKKIITHGCALSAIQNVENKATEYTLQMADLHQKHHQAVSASLLKLHLTSLLGRCLLSIKLLEFAIRYTLNHVNIIENQYTNIPIYIGIRIQTELLLWFFQLKTHSCRTNTYEIT